MLPCHWMQWQGDHRAHLSRGRYILWSVKNMIASLFLGDLPLFSVYLVKLCQVLTWAEICDQRCAWAVKFTWKSIWRALCKGKTTAKIQTRALIWPFAWVDCWGAAVWLRKACELALKIPEWSFPLSFTSTVKQVVTCAAAWMLLIALLLGIWLGDGGNDCISARWPG